MAAAQWRLAVMGCGSSSSTPKLRCRITNRKDGSCMCNQEPFNEKNRRNNPMVVLSRVPSEQEREEESVHNSKDAHSQEKTAEENPVGTDYFNILIDAGKTFRDAGLRHFVNSNITHIDDVLITHGHMDAIGGLDDIREMQKWFPGTRKAMPTRVFMDHDTTELVSKMYSFLFPAPNYQRFADTAAAADEEPLDPEMLGNKKGLYVAQLENFIVRDFKTFHIGEMEVHPIPLYHGAVLCMGFTFKHPLNNKHVVYLSDFRCKRAEIPEGENKNCPTLTEKEFQDLSLFVDPLKSVDAIKRYPISYMFLDAMSATHSYASHSSLDETISLIKELYKQSIQPDRIYLTGMSCSIDYPVVNDRLKGLFGEGKVMCAHDGLILDI